MEGPELIIEKNANLLHACAAPGTRNVLRRLVSCMSTV